jgi:hypothetical protein
MGLYCKPFRYFLDFVAPEMLERYPIEDRGCFAKGTIQSKSNPQLCIEVAGENEGGNMPRELLLNKCETNHINPSVRQSFVLTWHRNIQHSIYDFCIHNTPILRQCHFRGGNEVWRYDLVGKYL